MVNILKKMIVIDDEELDKYDYFSYKYFFSNDNFVFIYKGEEERTPSGCKVLKRRLAKSIRMHKALYDVIVLPGASARCFRDGSSIHIIVNGVSNYSNQLNAIKATGMVIESRFKLPSKPRVTNYKIYIPMHIVDVYTNQLDLYFVEFNEDRDNMIFSVGSQVDDKCIHIKCNAYGMLYISESFLKKTNLSQLMGSRLMFNEFKFKSYCNNIMIFER